jgi:1-acyl-sn-glycerol-3-phosphate acyltransferase
MTELYSRTHPKPAPGWLYYGVRGVFSALASLLIRTEVIGRENIPAAGPYLITTNHLSFFDSVLIYCIIPHRMVALGADKWRRTPGLRQFLEMLGIIWVARGEADTDAIKATLAVLKSGGPLGLAPEGTRSRGGKLQPGKAGAAYLADRARVPILPIGQAGTEHVLSSWKRLRRPRVRFAIGAPFTLPGNGRAKGKQLEDFTEEIMCRIAALLPADYRGAYAEHARVAELLGAASQPVAVGQPE